MAVAMASSDAQPGNALGHDRHEHTCYCGRDEHPCNRPADAQHDAFGEQLADDATLLRSERLPHGELAQALGPGAEQQQRDVRARRDEQHERCARQNQQRDTNFRGRLRDRCDEVRAVRDVFRVDRRESSQDRRELLLRVCE
jgi:hypothetical protein